MVHWLPLWFLGALLALAGSVRAETVIKHYGAGYSPSIDSYLYQVLKLTLEQTRTSHGDYRLEVYRRPLSASRAKLEAERGELVNALFSSHWTGTLVDPTRVIRVEFPIFFGRLGLRELVVKREMLATFAALESRSRFYQLRAGQGAGWPEVDILRANGVEVAEGHLFEALFAMLMRGRFDYLPLSVLEARPALAHLRESYPTLAVEGTLRIFYPVPFYLWVPVGQPEIAERLQAGLALAQDDGSLEQLFKRHFARVLNHTSDKPHRLVLMENPLIDTELGERLTRQYLEANPNDHSLLP